MMISKGSVASQGGLEPVFLKKPITTCDLLVERGLYGPVKYDD